MTPDETTMSNNMAMTQALIVQLCNAGVAISSAIHEGYTYLCELLLSQGHRNTASCMALAATMLPKVAMQVGVHPNQRALVMDMQNTNSASPYNGARHHLEVLPREMTLSHDNLPDEGSQGRQEERVSCQRQKARYDAFIETVAREAVQPDVEKE